MPGFWDGYQGGSAPSGKGIVAGGSTVDPKTGRQPTQRNPSKNGFWGDLEDRANKYAEDAANQKAAANTKQNKADHSFFGNQGTAAQVSGHVGDFIGSIFGSNKPKTQTAVNSQKLFPDSDITAEQFAKVFNEQGKFKTNNGTELDLSDAQTRANLRRQLDNTLNGKDKKASAEDKAKASFVKDNLDSKLLSDTKQTIHNTGDVAYNLSQVPKEVAQGAAKAVVRIGGDFAGQDQVDVGALGEKLLGERKIKTIEGYGKDVTTDTGKLFGKDLSGVPKLLTDIVGLASTVGDATPLAAGTKGVTTGTKAGLKAAKGDGIADFAQAFSKGSGVDKASGVFNAPADAIRNAKGKNASKIAAPDPNVNKPQLDAIDENLAKVASQDPQYLKDNNLLTKGKSDSLTLAESKLAEPERRQLHDEAAAKIVDAETQLQKLNEFRTQSPYFRQLDRIDTAKQTDIDGLKKIAKERNVDSATLKDALNKVETDYKEKYDALDQKFPNAKASLPQLDAMQRQLSMDRLQAHKEAQDLQLQDEQTLKQTDGMVDVPDPDAIARHQAYLEAQKQHLTNQVRDATVRADTPANNSLEANQKIEDTTNPQLHPEHFDESGKLTDNAVQDVQKTQVERASANLIDSHPVESVAATPGLRRDAKLTNGETAGNQTYAKIMDSATITEETKKLVNNMKHDVQNVAKTEHYAEELVNSNINAARELFDSEAYRVGDSGTHMVLGKKLAEAYDAMGDVEASSAVWNKVISAKGDVARGLAMGNVDVISPFGIIKHAEKIASDKGKTLTDSQRVNLREAAKYIQTLKNGPEKQAAMRNLLNAAEQRGVWDKTVDTFKAILSLPRTIMTTADLSFGLRQGAILGTRYPAIWAKAEGLSARWAVDPKFFEKSMQDILTATDKRGNELAPLYKRMGLSLEGAEGRSEETFGQTSILESKLAKHALIGHVVAGSDRAFSGAAAYLRANVAKKIINQYGGVEAVSKWDNKALTDLGRVIDTATGRGSGGQWFEKAAPTLGQTLFSARLWKSRLDTLNPVYYARLSPPARKVALQSAGAFASLVTATLAAASASGADVETNPLSSDFGKIKVGDTRYDIMGGLQQNIVLGARLITGKTMNANGDITDLGTENGSNDQPWVFNQNDRGSAIGQTLTNKLSPVVATTKTLLEGKDFQGNPIDPWAEVAKLFIPLGIQDAVGTADNANGNVGAIAANAAPAFFGVGVNTYGAGAISKGDQAKVDAADPQDYQKYQDFYKTATTITGRTARNTLITNLIKDGKVEEARRKANEFNTTVDEKLQPFYDKYDNLDSDLTDELNKNIYINLTDKSIKQRAAAK